ncbi:MAG: SDR family oxidoreductase [Kordiimonadaceae bacterium]|jgi:NAD(P)-dependent dehydrogenase (short-subunit alcohol dehydrogenase family)|nr:SDR family oxidoreductase [Kordiimonadaceae bacterium]MBT6031853.1 SDR family oxidoreductase [Kordiimonadaceae bacterium]
MVAIKKENEMSIIVTGAAMGIGEAVALKSAAEGKKLVLIDRAEEELKTLKEKIISEGGDVEIIIGSVVDPDVAERAVEVALSRFGRIDGLSHNAGIQRYGSALTTTDELWDEVININLKSAFILSRAVLPELIKTKGAIVMMASVQGLATQNDVAAYTTSKHGLIGLTKSIAIDFAKYNVRANAVAPGSVDTPMLRNAVALSDAPEKVMNTINAMHPLGRSAKASEVAELVCFLLSGRASFITGEVVKVDGGLLTQIAGSPTDD